LVFPTQRTDFTDSTTDLWTYSAHLFFVLVFVTLALCFLSSVTISWQR